MKLTQGAFLVSYLKRIHENKVDGGSYPCKKPWEPSLIMDDESTDTEYVIPSDTDAAQRKSCGEERFGS
jgi:hypothetical protein